MIETNKEKRGGVCMVCVRGVTRSPEVVSMWPLREGYDNMISLVHKKYGKGQNRLAYRTKRCLYGGGAWYVWGGDFVVCMVPTRCLDSTSNKEHTLK